MSRCSACQRPCRKTKLAYVAKPDGTIEPHLVCLGCHGRAVVIVSSVTTPPPEGPPPSEVKRRESAEVVKGARSKIEGIITAYACRPPDMSRGASELGHHDGRLEGLRMAIDILRAGDF